MESISVELEELLHAKIMLYRDLVDLLKEEKTRIIEGDVGSLWRISDKKQKVALEIIDCRRMILTVLTDAGIVHDMEPASLQVSRVLELLPDQTTGRLANTHISLITLKDEIQDLIRGNLKYIEEYLMIFDDLLGIITHSRDSLPSYGKGCCPDSKRSANVLIHKEV